MTTIYTRRNESLDSLLRRFKTACDRDGILSEIKKREHYIKPSRKRHEADVKRKYRQHLINTGKLRAR